MRCTSSVSTGLRRPDVSYSPRRVLTTSSAFTLPLASPMMRCGADRNTMRAPSFSAASVSSSIAGMSLRSRRYTTITSAPLRNAVRAESMAALPPPMTTTLRPRFTESPLATDSSKGSAGIDAFQLGARQIHPRLFPGPDGQEHGIEALVQFVERDVGADAGVERELHAQPLDQFDLAPQDRLGQAILRQREAQHATGLGQRIEHGDIVSQQRQVERRGQSGRSGARDGDLAPGVLQHAL